MEESRVLRLRITPGPGEFRYARTSTEDQIAGSGTQQRALKADDCTKIFCEQMSSVAERPQLEAARSSIRNGDIDEAVVTRLDRSTRDPIDVHDRIKARALR